MFILDLSHGLADRLSSALSFGELPAAERTPFMVLAMDDAVAHADGVDPKKAVPMEKPLAMKSFVAFGHRYILYAYRKFDVPAGVELRDANEILP